MKVLYKSIRKATPDSILKLSCQETDQNNPVNELYDMKTLMVFADMIRKNNSSTNSQGKLTLGTKRSFLACGESVNKNLLHGA